MAAPPDILASRFRVQERLGQGGLCEVYSVWDMRFERERAVKFLRRHHRRNSRAVGRVLNEARSLAKLSHAHIMPISDLVEDPAVGPVIVMRRVRGPNLHQWAVKNGAMSVAQAAWVVRAVAAALVEAHGHGVVHRDLKPSNVMLDEGRVVVMDFGIARLSSHHVSVTETHSTLGTVYFMSPEQRVSPKSAGAPSDIYSLGVLFHRLMLPGRRIDVGVAALKRTGRLWTEVPSQVRPLLAKMCSMDAALRPTASEVHAALESLPAEPLEDAA